MLIDPPEHSDASPVAGAFIGGGRMGELMRGKDWTATALGPVESWPQSLRSALSICLGSSFQIAIYWGPELALLYNDAWSPILGTKHPQALGHAARDVWPEIWDTIGPLFAQVFATGAATRSRDQLLPMHRHGFTEECYFDYTFSPIRGEDGRVGGIFNAVLETTFRVIGERRTGLLARLGERIAGAQTPGEAGALAAAVLSEAGIDLPFSLIYLCDSSGSEGAVHLAGASGVERNGAVGPDVIRSSDIDSIWPVHAALRSRSAVLVEDLSRRLGREVRMDPWPEACERALVIRFGGLAATQYAGVLVAGISPRLALDAEYRGFIERVAASIGAAVTRSSAMEQERQRAQVLAEIDRAKTAFFSNISHEFRTPLTLMMGPIEDALHDRSEPLTPAQRERVSTAQRNSQRLLRLVNTLLDFSRIEAGRLQGRFEQVDLGALTTEIASNFASAFERAGLSLTIDCRPLPEAVYADRDMWEKIVLNLLSNAFKFTFQGGAKVRLSAHGTFAELSIQDTGVGVPVHELPRLFERFHRIEGQRSRTSEGSGIGLALVQELVRLQGGEIRAASTVGRGTTFVVTIPFGISHLPAERIVTSPAGNASLPSRATAFVHEALGWLPRTAPEAESAETVRELAALKNSAGRPRVVLAEDNADMRAYVCRLLGSELEVMAAANGREALELIRAQRPDLVLSDVMMPELDGFGLLGAIRSDERLKDLAVILLSARAGEEARVEGISAGADDYLTKPFSARELVARVRSNIELGRVRREATASLAESEARFRNMADHAPVMMWVTEPDARCSYLNRAWYAFTGQTPEQAEGFGRLDATHPDDRAMAEQLFRTANENRQAFRLEYRLRRHDGEYRWAIDAASPRFGADGRFAGYIGSVIDITERKQAEQVLQRSNLLLAEQVEREIAARAGAEQALRQAQKMEALGQLTGGLAHDFNNMLVVIIGNLDMLLRRLDRGESNVQRFASNALEAGNRAASMTQRLLTFARQQPMIPEAINANKLVANMSDLLHRTLGEIIRTETVLSGGLWRVYTDANQLESAILNLAVNARDAMAEGGKLTIETANAHLDDAYAAQHTGVPQGQYVMIAVTDTGSGMSPETISKAFDPFFTTKPVGKGTGLGLSQVHGFVHQCGGHVKIYSELGQGTTVKIYLPRYFGAAEAAPRNIDAGFIPLAKGQVTVLAVEDEESVRALTVTALRELGYTVLEANGAARALELLEAHPEVDLLFTDVVMPDVNGRKLADEALRRRPDLRVLYTTGYTRNAIVHNGVLDPGVNLISKPFNLQQLARKLEEALASR